MEPGATSPSSRLPLAVASGFCLPSARFLPGFCPGFRCFRWALRVAGALMLPKRRRARVVSPSAAPSSAARFPGVTIYLAEPHMGRSRQAFLTRLAVSKGFHVLNAYRCAVVAKLTARRGHLPGAAFPGLAFRGARGGCRPKASPHRGMWHAHIYHRAAAPGRPRGAAVWRDGLSTKCPS